MFWWGVIIKTKSTCTTYNTLLDKKIILVWMSMACIRPKVDKHKQCPSRGGDDWVGIVKCLEIKEGLNWFQ